MAMIDQDQLERADHATRIAQPGPVPPMPGVPARRNSHTNKIIVAVIAGCLLLGVGAVVLMNRAASPSPLENAAATCNVGTSDGGSTVSIPVSDSGTGIADWQCVVSTLPVPTRPMPSAG
jgi:hypothetical protein